MYRFQFESLIIFVYWLCLTYVCLQCAKKSSKSSVSPLPCMKKQEASSKLKVRKKTLSKEQSRKNGKSAKLSDTGGENKKSSTKEEEKAPAEVVPIINYPPGTPIIKSEKDKPVRPSSAEAQKTQADSSRILKGSKEKTTATGGVTERQLTAYEKKAAEEGTVVNPQHVQYKGNIDDMLLNNETKRKKEIEEMESDKSISKQQSVSQKNKPKPKVRINEKKCVLFETNDQPTLYDQDEEDEEVDDIY